MKLTGISSIGRGIDFDYPSNRAITIVTILAMVGGTLSQRQFGVEWGGSLLWGVNAGLSVFLTWALGRELDPDHALSSFVAASLALVGLVLWGLPRLSAILWLIMVIRVVNRSTGLAATLLDSLAVLGLGSWLALQGNWGYGILTALAFFLDSQLPQRARHQLAFTGLSVIATAVIAIVARELPWEGPLSIMAPLIGLALSVLFLPVFLDARHLVSVGDRSQQRLAPTRVQAAQVLALLAGVETAILGGTAAFGALLPLWAAVLGASIYWFYLFVKP